MVAPPASFKLLTLNQFKSWLEGVEEMQGEDWTPSPEQWKKIRNKISLMFDDNANDLESLVRRVVATTQSLITVNSNDGQVRTTYQSNNGSDVAPRQFIENNSSPLVIPPGGSGLDNPTSGIPLPAVKTPNIDTSQGSYKTPFL